jgi:WD40 repeat protein
MIMNKMLLGLFILGSFSLRAMELSRYYDEVTIGKVRIRIKDNLEEKEDLVRITLARYSAKMRQWIDSNGKDSIILLPELQWKEWKVIEFLLEQLVEMREIPFDRSEQLYKHGFVRAIASLDSLKFIVVLKAVHYLDIPLLHTSMVQHWDIQKLTYEQFSNLSLDVCKALLLRGLTTKLGPLPTQPIQPVALFLEHAAKILSAYLVKDKIVSYSDDKRVRVWDLAAHSEIAVCKGQVAPITSVDLEGDKVTACSEDKTIRVWKLTNWRLTNGSEIAVCRGHTAPIISVSLEGDKVIAWAEDKTIRVWNLATGTEIIVCKGPTGPIAAARSVKGKLIVCANEDKRTYTAHKIWVWDLATGLEMTFCKGHTSPNSSVSLAGDKLISCSEDNAIYLWDLTAEAEAIICRGHTAPVTSVRVAEDTVISCSKDDTMRLWNLATGGESAICKGTECHDVLGNKIVSTLGNPPIHIRDLATGALTAMCLGHKHMPGWVSIVGGKIVSGCSADFSVRVWDLATGTELATYNIPRGGGSSITFMGISGDMVVILLWDGSVHILDLTTSIGTAICRDSQLAMCNKPTCIVGDKIFIKSESNRIELICDFVVYRRMLNKLHSMTREQANAVFDSLKKVPVERNNEEEWQKIAKILKW